MHRQLRYTPPVAITLLFTQLAPTFADGCGARLGLTPTAADVISCVAEQSAEIAKLRESALPKGAVAFFDELRVCPQGWREKTEAVGRYVVGTSLPNEVGEQVGTELKSRENRAVGKHTHTYLTFTAGGRGSGLGWDDSDTGAKRTTPPSKTDPTGEVEGTNAPYIQLLVCEKLN